MSLAAAIIAILQAATTSVAPIDLPDRLIRAGDLADIAGHEDTIVGSLPRGATHITLAPADAARLLTNRLPGVPFTLSFAHPLTLTAPATMRPEKTCWSAKADIRPGEVLTENLLEPTDCAETRRSDGLGFDRDRNLPVATSPISSREYLGAFKPAPDAGISAGAQLVFRTSEGPVLVERRVTALQSGNTGGRLFARTTEGEVIAAPLLTTKPSNNEDAQ